MVFFNVAERWREALRRHGETAVMLYVAASFILVLSVVGFVLNVTGNAPEIKTQQHSYSSMTTFDAR
jgi:hypothetical protein